jgi:voltage-gated potassium channel
MVNDKIHEPSSPLRRPIPVAWQVLMLLTSVGVLLVLAISLLMPLPVEIKRMLDWADLVICVVFMSDFFLLLYLHTDRKRYLLTWGWLDFLSSIPIIDQLRWGRLARVIRLLRLFRGLRGSASLLRQLLAHRRETALVAILLTLFIVAVFSSVAILVAEEGSSSAINTAEEAIWWTLTTMTTVGYGDLAPVTTLGRAVAVLTMFAGIGVFGAFTALIASLLISHSDQSADFKQLELRLQRIEQALLSSASHQAPKSSKDVTDEG